jgi:hypothetical protein
VEVDRAYKKGLTEERTKHKEDMLALNNAIEVKETRITELLVNIHEMENKLVFSDREMVKIKEEMEQMKFEVADTIAGLTSLAAASSSSNNNGEIANIGPSNLEMENAREELDRFLFIIIT